MARYNLPKPMSMYRDTGLVDITKQFRERYVQNMAADNALAKAVLEMDSMEEDQEAKRRLIEKYNAQLKQRSESGNYHLLGNAVVKDAQNFTKDYNPIKRSKANYDTWLENLTKQRDAFIKTGKGVDPFTYNGKIAEAKYNYAGLKFNADGTVDESTIFNGPSYVGYVDVESKIIKHMKDVVMKEIDTTGMETPLDENMQIIKDPNSTAYYVQQGSYKKYLEPELVQSVVTSVLNQPDTKAYTRQTAHLENFTKDRINPDTNLSLATEELNDRLDLINNELNTLETKKPKNKKERQELETAIELREFIEEQILESREQGVDDVEILTNLNAYAKEAAYIQSAVTKYAGVKSEKYVRDYTESSRFNQNMKNKEAIENAVSYRWGADNFVVEPLGGTTFMDINNQLLKNEAALAEYNEEYVKRASKAVTNAQIDRLAADFNVDPATARQQAANIRYNQRVIELLNKKKEKAFQAMGITPEDYEAGLEEFYTGLKVRNTSAVDLTAAINDLGLLPNPSVGQALSYLSDLENSEDSQFKEIASNILNYMADQKYGQEQSNRKNEGLANMGSELREILDKYDNKVSKDSKELESYFAKDIPTDVIIMPSFGDPGGTTSGLVEDLFKEGLFNDFQLIDKAGNEITYGEVKENQKGIFNLSNYGKSGQKYKAPEIDYEAMGLAHVPRPDGKAVIAIPFIGYNEDGSKTKEMYFADVDQIKTPAGSALSNYINSTQFRVRTAYRHGLWADLPVWEPNYFVDTDEFLEDKVTKNPTFGQPTVRFDYANKLIYILDTTPSSPSFGEYIEFDEESGLNQIVDSLEKHNQSL